MSLVSRFRDQARFLLLQGNRSRRRALRSRPCRTTRRWPLPAERLDDLVADAAVDERCRACISITCSERIWISARLIHRLQVPFDVTVHDYYAICPQINLLPWRHSLYCGEPDIAGCNACIAHRSSHGARDIVTWRAEHAWQFKEAARVFCPSRDVLSRLQRHGLAANAVLAPHEPVAAGPWPLNVTVARRRQDQDRRPRHAGRSQRRTNRRVGRGNGRPEDDRDPPDRSYRRTILPGRPQANEDNRTL